MENANAMHTFSILGYISHQGPERYWAPVPGWPYEVSRGGDCRRAIDKRPLKPINSNGYLAVSLFRAPDRITKKIHRLVWESFMGGLTPGMVINHKNCDKTDNRIENLEEVTQAENIKNAIEMGRFAGAKGIKKRGRPNLTAEERDLVISMRSSGYSNRQVCEALSCSLTTVQNTYRGSTRESLAEAGSAS